jgi:hypothetical protein
VPILTKYATGATVVTSTWGTTTNAVGSTAATYATWAVTTANSSGTLDLTGYSFSDVVTDETINSVTVGVRHHVSSTARLLASQFQLYDGNTALGTLQTGTLTGTTTHEDTFTVTGLTWAQLRSGNLKVRFIARRGASTQAAATNLDFAYISLDYGFTPPSGHVGYRFRNDDGTQATATWKAALNTPVTIPAAEVFRVRLAIAGLGTVADFQTFYSLNGGAYTAITGSSTVVRAALSPNVAENEATTQQITTGTYVAGSISEADGYFAGATIPSGTSTEIEQVCSIIGADAPNGSTITIRAQLGNFTPFSSYPQVASLTVGTAVAVAAPARRVGKRVY